jgi:hypothetical protein
MFTLTSCGKTEQTEQTEQAKLNANNDAKMQSTRGASITRHTIMTMTFSKWGDVLKVDAGISQSPDGKCSFVDPIKQDASTRWAPFQIYWAVFDKESDVLNGTTISGTYSDQDFTDARVQRKNDGAKPLGFAYLSDKSARHVNLSEPERLNNGAELRTVLTISRHKAAIRTVAESRNGACIAKTESCTGGEECFSDGEFKSLGTIRVVQNIFGMPRAVQQRAELSVQ